MSIVVIYPLGNSDIQVVKEGNRKTIDVFLKENGNLKPVFGENYRSFTKKVNELLSLRDKQKGIFRKDKSISVRSESSINFEISFPIIGKLIDYLEDLFKGEKIIFYFLTTDQKNSNFSSQDTIYLYEILEKVLPQVYENFEVKKILIDFEPVDIEKLFPTINSLLNSCNEIKEEGNTIYLVFGPGVPSVNYVLISYFSLLGREGVYFFYTKRENDNTVIVPAPIKKYFHESILKKLVFDLIEKYDYTAAHIALRSYNDFIDRRIKYLSSVMEILHYRQIFNFEKSNYKIDRVLVETPEEYHKLKEFLKEQKKILSTLNKEEWPESDVYKTVELANRIAANFVTEKINEALALVFRLDEQLGKLIVEKAFVGRIEKSRNENYKDKFVVRNNDNEKPFEDTVKSFDEGKLFDYLRKKSPELKFDKPNRLVYFKIVSYLEEKEAFRNACLSFKELVEFIGSQEDHASSKNGNKTLSDLRNMSFYAHGFNGYDREYVEKFLERGISEVSNSILKYVRDTLLHLGFGEKINNYIRENLQIESGSNFAFKVINNNLRQIFLD